MKTKLKAIGFGFTLLAIVSCNHHDQLQGQYDQLSEEIRDNQLLIGHCNAEINGSSARTADKVYRLIHVRDSLEALVQKEETHREALQKQLAAH